MLQSDGQHQDSALKQHSVFDSFFKESLKVATTVKLSEDDELNTNIDLGKASDYSWHNMIEKIDKV